MTSALVEESDKMPVVSRGWSRFMQVTGALVKKNFILMRRNTKSTLLQTFAPFILLVLLKIISLAPVDDADLREQQTTFTPRDGFGLTQFPACIADNYDYCYDFAYITDDAYGDTVVSKIKEMNNIPTSRVLAWTGTSEELNVWLFANQNVTGGVYHFSYDNTVVPSGSLDISIQYNQTIFANKGIPVAPLEYYAVPMASALYRALPLVADSDADVTIDITGYPKPEIVDNQTGDDNISSFVYAALLFSMVIQMQSVVLEKELHLREALSVMGMKAGPFWISWAITNVVQQLISLVVLVVSGYALQYEVFLESNFFALFFLLLLFTISMVPFAFMVTTVVSKAGTATSIGFLMYLIGSIILGVAPQAFDPDFNAIARFFFHIFSPAVFAKGLSIMVDSSAGDLEGFKWSQRHEGDFSWSAACFWLFFNSILYVVLTWYLDQVNYYQRPWYFILLPRYWISGESDVQHPVEDEDPDKPDDSPDVEAVKTAIDSDELPDSTVLKVANVHKLFKKKKIFGKNRIFHAVRGMYLSSERGMLLALLGSNGAGKTTLIKMLTGVHSVTCGDATVCGVSVAKNMEKVRELISYCPQHDLLWDQLSGYDHCELFSNVRGLPKDMIHEESMLRLGNVGLADVHDRPSGAFSGGMKRRLSTTLAFIGEPKLVFLDEPTTGMDPVTRRGVWEYLEKEKHKRSILLTTHSMEEASTLADRIAICRFGRLTTYGSVLQLKASFGAGYRVTILFPEEGREATTSFVRDVISAEPTGTAPGQANYSIPRSRRSEMPDFFRKLDAQKELLGFDSVVLSNTTLEEVFLRVASEATEDSRSAF